MNIISRSKKMGLVWNFLDPQAVVKCSDHTNKSTVHRSILYTYCNLLAVNTSTAHGIGTSLRSGVNHRYADKISITSTITNREIYVNYEPRL